MNDERWRRIQQLFEQAQALSPDQHDAFLADARGADEALRHEVESLLEHCGAVEAEFLQPPPRPPGLGSTLTSIADPLVGKQIGEFHIEHLIGRGGMGAVYRARQEHPRRVVALKVLSCNIGSRGSQRRFESEAEILARMRHPNIAQVYLAGTHTVAGVALPYFAMEYVPDALPADAIYRAAGAGYSRAAGPVRPGVRRRAPRPSEGNHPSRSQACQRADRCRARACQFHPCATVSPYWSIV